MGDYRKLQVWDLSHKLAVRVFQASTTFPRSHRAEISDQLRRSALSVPANIVEGCGRNGTGDTLRHFRIALGSANELEYLLLFCRDTGLVTGDEGDSLVMEANSVRRMLASLINRVGGAPRKLPAPAESAPDPPAA